MSITKQEVSGCKFRFFLDEYNLEPINCPRKKAGTVNRKVVNSNPLADKILKTIINSTGICIARKNCNEISGHSLASIQKGY
jgi:hypothetical protein